MFRQKGGVAVACAPRATSGVAMVAGAAAGGAGLRGDTASIQPTTSDIKGALRLDRSPKLWVN